MSTMVPVSGTIETSMEGVIIEPVRDSDIPVRLMQIETIDGLYAPIGLRTPKAQGPFPLILFARGNGGSCNRVWPR